MRDGGRPKRRLVAVVCLSSFVLGPSSLAAAATVRLGEPVMGTVLTVTVTAGDPDAARVLAEAAVAQARHWDDVLTTWRADGELARLNAGAGGDAVEVSADLARALQVMQVLSRETDGLFDPAVGPLVARWRGTRAPVPPPMATAATRVATALTLVGRRATLRPGAALDAGGIGKGMALDAMAALLRRGGARGAFLDFGGSSHFALGAPESDPAGWRVAIGGLAAGSVLGEIVLRDAALSTSRAAPGPSPAGPIIDPRSGAPVAARRLATARAADATGAEAWTKALVIAGRAALSAANAHGVAALIEDDEGVSAAGLTPQPLRP